MPERKARQNAQVFKKIADNETDDKKDEKIFKSVPALSVKKKKKESKKKKKKKKKKKQKIKKKKKQKKKK